MIRLTGMNSGLDTDSMVKELVSAYEKKGQKTKNAQTKAKWKSEIWTDLNKKIKSFNTKVKSLQYSSNYSQKKTVSSNENKVSVIAGDNSVKGTQTITVENLAKTAYVTSAKLTAVDSNGNATGAKVTADTKLSDLGVTSADNKITLTQNGKTTVIDANKDTTVGEFVDKLKAAGLQASFDENNARMFISAKESGAAANFTFTSTDSSVLSDLGISANTSMNSAELVIVDSEGKATEEKATSSTKLSDLGYSSENSTITITKNGQTTTVDINKDMSVADLCVGLREAGLNASIDEANGKLLISSTGNDFTISGDDALVNTLGLTKKSGASVIAGEDALIHLNGAEFTSSTNSFNINDMAISVKGLTDEGDEITLTTDVDVDTIYKNIKSLVSEYSKLINELSKVYNADSARKYDPLTDDEKEAMTDDEVEKWETKIKDSLLRGDGNVSSVMSAMKNATISTYTVNDKAYTLSDFGIGTLSYFSAADNEKSALHISGDEDDTAVSGETNKLKQMITSDPETVASFFSQMMTSLSDTFNKMTTSTTNRSYGNFYDDKKMKSDLTSYEKKVSEFEEYLADIEDKYYKQFTSMETAMAKLNSTQSQMSSYFG